MTTKLGNYITEYSVRNKLDEEIPVYSVTNDQGFCTGYFSKEVASKDRTTYKIVPKGYFAYNPSRINVGSIDCQNCEERVIVSPLYVVFGVDERIDKRYLLHYLKSDIALTFIKASTTGSVRDNLKFSKLSDFQITLYSLSEQQKIADTLDNLDAVIELRKAELTDLNEMIFSQYVKLFGDPIENPNNMSVLPLLEIGECKNGMNFHYNDSGVEINCLGVGDFKDHSIIDDTSKLPLISLNELPTNEYLLQNGDIVFVRSNGNKALVGRSVAVYPNDTPTTFSGFCIRFRIKNENIRVPYLLYTLKMESVRKQMAGRGANIQNLNQQILSALKIPIPPIELQENFSSFVAQIDEAKKAVQESLDNLEILKKSLMQKYFG